MAEENAEEKIDQLRYLQDIYGQQYELLNSEVASYSMAHDAIKRSIEFLEKAGSMQNQSMLVNAEGGIYLMVDAKDVKKVLAYVGAGYLVEKQLEEAKQFAHDNEKRSEDVIKRLLAEKKKIEDELIKISYQLAAFQQR